MALHEVGLEPESGLTGAGTAHDQDVLVPRRARVLWAAVHGEPLRSGKNDVVLENRVGIGLDVVRAAPAGCAVFHVFAKLFGVLAFDVDRQAQRGSKQNADEQIRRMEAGEHVLMFAFLACAIN